MDIMQEFGCNIIRVGIWNHAQDGHLDLDHVLLLCKRINQLGMQIMLDFHYSDTAADASRQLPPAAWAGLSFVALKDSVQTYTQRILTALKDQNTLPSIVQIGNEIDNGLLWGTGRISGPQDANWNNFAGLVKSGISGVKAVDASIPILLHCSQTQNADTFFSNLQQHGVPFDIMGISYYPWRDTKDLQVLQQRLNQLAATFNKPVFIAETAYPYSLRNNYDLMPNFITSNDQLIYPQFFATQAGQLQFLTALKKVIAAIPGNMGLGFSYQNPEWTAYRGEGSYSSPWENMTLFDFYGMVNPAMNAMRP
jgi:arabinogalactan endo-1,4-beta-galactosidase